MKCVYVCVRERERGEREREREKEESGKNFKDSKHPNAEAA